jgi:hypothetical protein
LPTEYVFSLSNGYSVVNADRSVGEGDGFLVAADVDSPSEWRIGKVGMPFVGSADLIRRLAKQTR